MTPRLCLGGRMGSSWRLQWTPWLTAVTTARESGPGLPPEPRRHLRHLLGHPPHPPAPVMDALTASESPSQRSSSEPGRKSLRTSHGLWWTSRRFPDIAHHPEKMFPWYENYTLILIPWFTVTCFLVNRTEINFLIPDLYGTFMHVSLICLNFDSCSLFCESDCQYIEPYTVRH